MADLVFFVYMLSGWELLIQAIIFLWNCWQFCISFPKVKINCIIIVGCETIPPKLTRIREKIDNFWKIDLLTHNAWSGQFYGFLILQNLQRCNFELNGGLILTKSTWRPSIVNSDEVKAKEQCWNFRQNRLVDLQLLIFSNLYPAFLKTIRTSILYVGISREHWDQNPKVGDQDLEMCERVMKVFETANL